MRQIGTLRSCVLLLVIVSLLSACSPELDWRDLRSAEGRFTVLMPARPSTAAGSDSAGRPQVLWAAQAGGALFSVGYTDHEDAAKIDLTSVRDALVRSARGELMEEKPTGSRPSAGREFTIQGLAADGSDRILRVWLFASGTRVYQLAVTGRPGSVGLSEAETFVASFKIEQ